MRIIISPAKKMRVDADFPGDIFIPKFVKETEMLLSHMKGLEYEEAKDIWKCNDKIAQLNYGRVQTMDLYRNLTPSILAYEGIPYQYMAPDVFCTDEFNYIQEHLRILSGFYGMLKPFDGVTPYRLEMQARIRLTDACSLYDFWKDKIASELFSESSCIINLASKEYSKCISDYVEDGIRLITCVFGERKGNKVIEKGTQVKMARGEMVRFMAEKQIKEAEDIKSFDRLNYFYSEEFSDKDTYVFINGDTGLF
ncbi:MAG TPA: peroxide stress protein YaaA [Clostridiales bacterium]|nr:peroxide stress protein YaaA [Clostridiales bacterium]